MSSGESMTKNRKSVNLSSMDHCFEMYNKTTGMEKQYNLRGVGAKIKISR